MKISSIQVFRIVLREKQWIPCILPPDMLLEQRDPCSTNRLHHRGESSKPDPKLDWLQNMIGIDTPAVRYCYGNLSRQSICRTRSVQQVKLPHRRISPSHIVGKGIVAGKNRKKIEQA